MTHVVVRLNNRRADQPGQIGVMYDGGCWETGGNCGGAGGGGSATPYFQVGGAPYFFPGYNGGGSNGGGGGGNGPVIVPVSPVTPVTTTPQTSTPVTVTSGTASPSTTVTGGAVTPLPPKTDPAVAGDSGLLSILGFEISQETATLLGLGGAGLVLLLILTRR